MSLIQNVLAKAKRIQQTYAWGQAVWHCWGRVQHAPLVLLHGGSGSWTHWIKNVEHLAQSRHVWALDIPGFGDSELPHGTKDADDLVPYVAEILAHTFGTQAVDVMGFSFGGMLAGMLAAEHPNAVRQMILVGVPGLGLFGRKLPMRGMHPEMNAAEQREVHRHNMAVMMLHDAKHITEEVIDLQEANVNRDRLRRRRISNTDIVARLQTRWQIPVYGVWGAHDVLYRDTFAQIPQVLHSLDALAYVPEAGHWVMFEQPDAFHQTIAPWLVQAG
jgi:2-hydroxy-6-oxonona-2,4-dienedioate hydrolase